MIKTDVLIIGGGPAGLGAAIETTKRKLKTLIIEENPLYGGQLIKQTHKFFGSSSHFAGTRGILIHEKLYKEIESNYLTMKTNHSVIAVYDDNIIGIHDKNKDKFLKVNAKKVILATGASEKTIPFKNNDLPGIYGAGGVQTLMNVNGVLPGKKILMIGAGNIGLIVSYQLIQAGAEVVGIVEAMSKQGGYLVHLDKVKRLGVPLYFNHTIVEAYGDDKVEKAVIAKVDKNWNIMDGTQKTVECDTICLAVGLTPTSELLWQAGVEMEFNPVLGGYIPKYNEYMETNKEKFFVAGDAAGIGEATSAIIEGRVAGISAAKSLGAEKNAKKFHKPLIDYINNLRDGSTGIKVKKAKFDLWGKELKDIKEVKIRPNQKGKIKKDRKQAYVVIECTEDIPCNPCEASCPFDAIDIGKRIVNIPVVDLNKCTGCLSCITSCPGLAIFGITENVEKGKVVISIPYELYPLPEKGDRVWAVDKNGQIVSESEIYRVRKNKNKTNIVSIIVDEKYKDTVRHFYPQSKGDTVICRCNDITAKEINDAIDDGYTDFEELKRYLRVTMGPCQGRGCRHLVMGMIRSKTGKDVSKGSTGTRRPPESSLPFKAIIKENKKRSKK
ncbi:FAD-dependent oxidoreductase [bacterium]|nr:FAD-dependent oxidoreductase [bacterium]